ncbi:oxidase [Lithospermum erythrorhizon]|uniref:Oxidase n=1 Tax=Lithospermum erythrorhizon TaxID=34254 RepID=A0AAV3NIC6_LITER
MVLESYKLWEQAEAEVGYKVFFKTCQLDMGPIEDKSLQALIASCKNNEIDVRVLNQDQVEEEFSGKFKLPENWVGLVTEQGGVIKPTKAVSMFQALGLKNGAILKDNAEVVQIKKGGEKGGVFVCTKGNETFWAEKCVITAGSWMNKLIKQVSGNKLELPIQPLETGVCYWKIKEGKESEFTFDANFPTFASYGLPYIYGTPSLEFPGLIKIAVHNGRPCDPDKRTFTIDALTSEALTQWIQNRFGDLVDSTRPVMTQSCLYSMTPDEDFVIDYLGGEFGEDVLVAGGFSGHGFKMAPIVGRILVDLICEGETKGGQFEHFKLTRFKKNPKGNMKEFSDQVNFVKNEVLVTEPTN